jgi:hypothetical protein
MFRNAWIASVTLPFSMMAGRFPPFNRVADTIPVTVVGIKPPAVLEGHRLLGIPPDP